LTTRDDPDRFVTGGGASFMDVDFAGKDLSRLYADKAYKAGYDELTVKALRLRVQQILAAPDESTLAALKSVDYRQDKVGDGLTLSMKLTDREERLILEKRAGREGTVIVIVDIVGVSVNA
jgi:plasmid maintenance system killer protein